MNEYEIYDLDSLTKCSDVSEIDAALDYIGIVKDIRQRMIVLCHYMGIRQSFAFSGRTEGFSLDEEYKLAKRQLVCMNEDLKSGK